MKDFPALTPAQKQVREWLRHPPLEAINIVRESLGDIFAAIPGRNGGHAIIQIVVTRDCNVLQYRDDVRRRLDSIDWQWVTLSMDEVATPGKLCVATRRCPHQLEMPGRQELRGKVPQKGATFAPPPPHGISHSSSSKGEK
jgi:hypothetical protein